MLTEQDINALIRKISSDLGCVAEIKPESNKADFFALAGTIMERLTAKAVADLNPQEVLPELYEKCIDHEVNSDGLIKGIYIDIVEDMIVLDVVLDKVEKTDFPGTYIYNVYGYNLQNPILSEYGTSYIQERKKGEFYHISLF